VDTPICGSPYLPIETLWAISRGSPNVCVAIIDGPVDLSHPCFRGSLVEQVSNWPVSGQFSGLASAHGTHVASVIFGQPGSSVTGIAPGCRGLFLPVFGDGPAGNVVSCSQLDLARAMLLAVDNGAHVINISGGQLSQSTEPEPLLARAISWTLAVFPAGWS